MGRQRLVRRDLTPSASRIRRRARPPIAGSWVTTKSVKPRAFMLSISSTISAPETLSRFPVGSSASRIAGSMTTARAMATRWRSPPESWSGR